MSGEETKKRIIEVAAILFAQKGFEGASVREIAKKAEVNLAAINYHFSSKQNLYEAVFVHNWDWLAGGIRQIGNDKTLNLEALCFKVFDFFVENGDKLLNCFRIVFSDFAPTEAITEASCSNKFGPPGGEVFVEVINREFSNDELPEMAKMWMIGSIFSHLEYMALISTTPYLKKKCEKFNIVTPSDLKQRSIIHLVQAISRYAKDNAELWRGMDCGAHS